MVFHAYEDGFYNKGRQTMLVPIEWTKDGWYKIPDGIKDDQPLKKPNLPASKSDFTLSDTFAGNKLKSQWHFFGEYDTTRFHLANNGITIKGKGNWAGTSSPLLCIPSDHSYTVDVELHTEGNTTGGLLLFYNNNAYSGILTDGENLLANLRGWQFTTERNVIKKRVFLRMKNVNNIVDMYYSIDGIKWNKIESSLDVSAMHHNVLNGFMSMRIGLCSMGEGSVTFKNFKYLPIK
jgi:beta-xylosidase